MGPGMGSGMGSSGAVPGRPSRMHGMSMSTRAAVFAIAGVAAMVTGAVSAPVHVALVEDVSGHPAGAQLMDYVEPGQVIRLDPGDRIVLGYLRSCVRETITG